jgi:hypothetical protein
LAKLRDRLRDFDPAKAMSVAVVVPTVLAASTVRAATASTVAIASVPPAIHSLVEGVLHMFWVKKATGTAAALFAVFTLGVGIGVGTRSDFAGATASEGGGAIVVAGEEKPVPVAPQKDAPPNKGEDPQALLLQLKKQLSILLQLKKQLSSAEAEVTRSKKVVETAEEQLRAAMASGNKELIAEASEKLAQARHSRDAAQAECEALRRFIPRLEEKLKATGPENPKPAKPEPPKTFPALNNLFGKPTELEETLKVVQAQVAKAKVTVDISILQLAVAEKEAKPEQIQAAKAALAAANAEFETAKHGEEVVRHKLAAAKALTTPPLKAVGACIEVVVIGGGEPWPCRVREYGREGQFLGSVIAENGPALELVMTRVMKDGNGPRDLWLTVSPEQSPAAVLQAAEACKKAGFTRISINGALPNGVEIPLKLK